MKKGLAGSKIFLPPKLARLKVSLGHDWLTGMRGGEKVLEALLSLFPEADIHTLLHIPEEVSPLINNRTVHTSFVERLPWAKKLYRHYLPLFPMAVKTMGNVDCDLLLSSSHCAIKALKSRGAHISYIHSPMRYIWDQYPQYYSQAGPLTRLGMALCRPWLQRWDVATCDDVDNFITNSNFVAGRIKRYYRRDALVVHPPVDLSLFAPRPGPKNYYLVVSALVPYKRVDLAILACNELKLPLKIVGTGPQAAALQAFAGATVEFLGWRDNRELAELYAGARAFIFPGEEDFGITPLEAMACGCPVVAYGRGGALETVRGENSPHPTGRFFYSQETQALVMALEQMEKERVNYDPAHLTERAAQFSTARFKQGIIDSLMQML